MDARAPLLDDQGQWLAEIGDASTASGYGRPSSFELSETALDPRSELSDGSGCLTRGGTLGQNDLHSPEVVNAHADAASPR